MPTTVATPTDIEKAKAALRAELAHVVGVIEARIAAGDHEAAIDALRAAVAQLATNEAADDAAFAALAARVDTINRVLGDVATRLAALELDAPAPPAVPPPPPTVPIPLPPDPPVVVGDGLTAVARIRVPAAGRVRAGVAVAPGLFAGAPGMVRVGSHAVAQADNAVIDRQGWLRWFLLSAIVPAGDVAIAIGAAAETAAPVPSPAPQAVVQIAGSPPAGTSRVHVADWRRGPVVTESIWTAPLGAEGLAVRLHESLWADGASSTTVIVENGRSVPGAVAARTQTYDIEITRGAERRAYAGVVHVPYTRWLRRLGAAEVYAEVVPLGAPVGGGSAWDHLRATRMLQNFASVYPAPPLAPLAALPDHPFAVSDAGSILHFTRSQGAPGANPDIGPHPAYYLGALAHLDADQLRVICANADARMGAAVFYRSAATGTFHRPDEGPEYVIDGRWQGTKIGLRDPGDTAAPNQGWAHSHWGAMFYIPYLLTGRLEYLEGQVAQQVFTWALAPWNNCGRQLRRHMLNFVEPYTEAFIGGQERSQLRSQGWAVRTTLHLAGMLPAGDDRVRALLGWDKTVTRTLWSNVCADLKKLYIADATGPGRRFDADGMHFIVDDKRCKQWQVGMIVTSLAMGAELGEMPPGGLDLFAWLAASHLAVAATPHRYRIEALSCDGWYKQRADGTPVRSVADFHAAQEDRLPDVYGSLESDWAGYIRAIAAFAVDHGLPNAAAAHDFALSRAIPNPNHNIAPRA